MVLVAQRFFFDLNDGPTTIHDVDGVLAKTIAEAIRQAREVLEGMYRNAELSISDEAWTVIIRDAVGETLMVIPVVPHDPTAT